MEQPPRGKRQPFPPSLVAHPQMGKWSPASVSSTHISHVSLGALTDGNGQDPSQALPVSPGLHPQRFHFRGSCAVLPPAQSHRRFAFLSGRLPG